MGEMRWGIVCNERGWGINGGGGGICESEGSVIVAGRRGGARGFVMGAGGRSRGSVMKMSVMGAGGWGGEPQNLRLKTYTHHFLRKYM